MSKSKYLRIVSKAILGFCLLMSNCLYAVDDATITIPITGSTLQPGYSTSWVDIPFYGNTSVVAKEHSTNTTVILEILEKEGVLIPSDFSVDVVVKIYYENISGNSGNFNQTFSIDYKKAPGQKFKAKDYFSAKGFKKVKLEIVSIDSHGANWNVNQVLSLKGHLNAKRDYVFEDITVNSFSAYTHAPVGQPFDEVDITWGRKAFQEVGHTLI
jgi:hypothetical protein